MRPARAEVPRSLGALPSVPDGPAGCAVLLTGAGGGIGTAVARALTRAGASMVLVDIDAAALDRVAAGCAGPGRVLTVPADVTEPRQVAAAVQAAAERFGSLDVAINGAGVIHADALLDVTLETWHRVFRVNLDSALLVTQAAARQMSSQRVSRWGRRGMILNIGSRAAGFGRPFSAAYGASKAALDHLTMSTCAALTGQAISAAVVCPGDVREGMLRNALPALAKAQGRSVDELVAERTFQAPSEFAETVLQCVRVAGMHLNGISVRADRSLSQLAVTENDHA